MRRLAKIAFWIFSCSAGRELVVAYAAPFPRTAKIKRMAMVMAEVPARETDEAGAADDEVAEAGAAARTTTG